MNYVYDCKGIEKVLADDQETVVEHGRLFLVRCSEGIYIKESIIYA